MVLEVLTYMVDVDVDVATSWTCWVTASRVFHTDPAPYLWYKLYKRSSTRSAWSQDHKNSGSWLGLGTSNIWDTTLFLRQLRLFARNLDHDVKAWIWGVGSCDCMQLSPPTLTLPSVTGTASRRVLACRVTWRCWGHWHSRLKIVCKGVVAG